MPEGQSSRTHTAPGEGESVWLVGDLIEVRLSAEDTGGAYSMIEETTPPGGGPPPHLHANEDEAFCVLEGEVEFLLGEGTIPAGAGTCVHAPKGHPAHVQERGDLAQPSFGGHHAGRIRGVLPRSGRTGDGGVLRARGSPRTWGGSWRSARSTASRYRRPTEAVAGLRERPE
jgi:mannose-6-phosphate isomerase-like protein (cupin superfamily)